jgi:multidrug resistance efflux pump
MGLLVVTAILVTACSPAATPAEIPINNPQAEAPTPLPTRAITPRTSVAVDGSLVLATPLVVASFEANGRIAKLNVTPGQEVKPGDVLAEIDASQLNEELARAKEQLTLKEAEIAQSLTPPKPGDVNSAKASLASAYARYNELKQGSSKTEVEQALRNWNQAKNSLYSSQLSRDVTCRIDPNVPAAQQKIDRNEAKCKQTELDVQNAELSERNAYQKYLDAQKPPTKDKLAGAYADITSAQANLAKLQSGVSDEQRKVYDLQLTQTKLNLERAERNLAKAKLISPCTCVVQDANLSVGASSTGSSVTLLDVSAVQFRTTNLSERDVVQMKLGQTATVRLKAYDRNFVGVVDAVLPLSSGTQNNAALFTVLIRLEPAAVPLLPGMTGQAEISL